MRSWGSIDPEYTLHPNPDVPDVPDALAVAARAMRQGGSLEASLERIVEAARRAVPGFDHVGISTLHPDGRVETSATTGELVRELDTVQYELDEGPCLESLRDADLVVAPAIRRDERWPRYVPHATAKGVQAQLAVRLHLDDEGTLGGINFYSTAAEHLHPDAARVARLFAAHAAVALAHARDADNLRRALASRQLIGQAVGIIMERYEIDEERAFAFLTRASSHGNTKLRAVAQDLVDHANSRPAGPGHS